MLSVIIAFGVTVCAICMVIVVIRDRIVGRAVLNQLSSLGETHKLGFEVLTRELDRMNARVSALEGRHLNVVRKVDP